MDNAAIIIDTLEQVAAREGDPNQKIYEQLFKRHPEFEDMFVMDTDGGVQASMLVSSLNCIIGVAEGDETPRNLLEAARMHHEGYGLQDKDIDIMFEVMRDVFRDILGERWTSANEGAWDWVLKELSDIGQTNPA